MDGMDLMDWVDGKNLADVPIDYYAFAYSGGVAMFFALGILAFNRRPDGYSKSVRAIVSAILALGFAPTVWWPYGKTYLTSAAFPLLSGVIGMMDLPWALLQGGVPLVGTFLLIYGMWNRCAKLGLKSQK